MDLMLEQADQAGVWTLQLLAERLTVRVLRELIDGSLQPSELERRSPEVAHSGLMRRLGELVSAGVVARERVVGVPPRAYYRLTDAGRALLLIADAAQSWEHRWSFLARRDVPGRWTLALLADAGNRALLRVLADGPLRPIAIDGRVSQLGRSATRRRLGCLLANGIISRTRLDGGVRYELTAAAYTLEPIAALAARWELQWGRAASPLVSRALCAHPCAASPSSL